MVSRPIEVVAGTMALVALVAPAALAQTDEAQISHLLGLAAKFIRERNARPLATPGLAARAALPALAEGAKAYERGQHWTVRFTPSGDPGSAEARRGGLSPGFFEFEVLDVTSQGEARIEVRRAAGDEGGRSIRDSWRVVLVMSRDLVPVRKEFYRRGEQQPARVVALAAAEPMAQGFDEMPLDLPNLNVDRGRRVRDGAGRSAREFRFNDLFGRPVEVLWREGAPWPARVRTSAGIAEVVER